MTMQPGDGNEDLFDDEGDGSGRQGQPLDPKIRRQMRDQEQKNIQLERELRSAKTHNVMADLRIPNEGVGKLFRDSYDGEATAEAVTAKAAQYGGIDAIRGAVAPPNQGANDPAAQRRAELEAELSRMQLAGQAVTDQGLSQEVSLDEAKRLLSAAKTPEEFEAILASDRIQALKSQPISAF